MATKAQLEAALRWALEQGISARHEGDGWIYNDSGCGCCRTEQYPDAEIKATVEEVLNSKPTS